MLRNYQRPPRGRLRIYPLHHGIFVSGIGGGGGLQMIISGVEDNHPLVASLVQKERGKLEYYRRIYCYQPHHLDRRNLRTDQHNNIAASSHPSNGVNNLINRQILPRGRHYPLPLQPWFNHLNHQEPELATRPKQLRREREEPNRSASLKTSLPQRSQHRANNTTEINVTKPPKTFPSTTNPLTPLQDNVYQRTHDKNFDQFCRAMNKPRKHQV